MRDHLLGCAIPSPILTRLLFAAILLLMLCLPSAASEVRSGTETVSNNHYEVRLAGQIPDGTTSSRYIFSFVFEVVSKSKPTEKRSFILGHRSPPLEEMEFHLLLGDDCRLVVLSRWTGRPKTSTGVHIVDLEDARIVDEFWCYDPCLSPSGRYWAYERFFYPYELPENRTMVILLYDMEHSPEDNRVSVVGYTERPESYVGIPVYPPAYAEAQAYVVVEQQMEHPGGWYCLESPFLWADDDSAVVFICSSEGIRRIVRIDLSEGFRNSKIFESEPVDMQPFVKKDLSQRVPPGTRDFKHSFEIGWAGPGTLLVQPDRFFYNLVDRFELPVP